MMIIAAATEQEHDPILCKVLDQAIDKGVHFNYKKIQFKVSEVEYMGNLVSSKGLKPDPKKVEAIIDMPTPIDIPNPPALTGHDKVFGPVHSERICYYGATPSIGQERSGVELDVQADSAMNKLCEVLTSEPVLAYYDVTKPVMIQADASQSGLGACLFQDVNPIAYTSRSMTSAEGNYTQIEKEMLAISFATKYIYGKPSIHVQTDHKPLESILKNLCVRIRRDNSNLC